MCHDILHKNLKRKHQNIWSVSQLESINFSSADLSQMSHRSTLQETSFQFNQTDISISVNGFY